MSFFKRLFQTPEEELSFIDYLEKIDALVRPSINPKDYQYSEFFLRNDFKFHTEHGYSLDQMREKTWITSLVMYKKKRGGIVWKGSIKELRDVYASPIIQFAMNELTPLLQKMKTTKHDIEHFESVIEYEETIQNIYQVLNEAEQKEGANAVFMKSIELLQHVVRTIQAEFQQLEQEETNELLERLILEEKYVKRNDK
ncbi:hypothetical protein [Lysinibacillus sp. LZ02]|uniref:hypothetical protein n=1 Tax=Lysinibacillus sp. LZ02 TaxID=3420668 RepID=UPI003D362D9C